jgi:hypothetical protein
LAVLLVSSAAGIAGFALAAFVCRLRIGDSDVVLSTLAIVVLPPGTPRCSSASADAGGEIVAHILSANKPDRAGVGPASGSRLFCDGQLDFSRQLNDLHLGPWEVLAPRSSSPEGDCLPLRGAFCVGWDAATLTQHRIGQHKPAHLAFPLWMRFTTAGVGQIWGGSFLPSAQDFARSRRKRGVDDGYCHAPARCPYSQPACSHRCFAEEDAWNASTRR